MTKRALAQKATVEALWVLGGFVGREVKLSPHLRGISNKSAISAGWRRLNRTGLKVTHQTDRRQLVSLPVTHNHFC